MSTVRIAADELAGKVIDVHSHVGVSLKAYATLEYPYAQTLEGLYYRQKACGVDVNVVFPFTADLFFDPHELVKGVAKPAARPLSPAPYAVENRLLMDEVFRFCPEYEGRFLPFVSIDPERDVQAQMRNLTELEQKFPIYGIKVNPVLCQSRIRGLLESGGAFLAFARERDIPFLIHTMPYPGEAYSGTADVFEVIEQNRDIRFCLAHGILFHDGYLKRADVCPNVWVDTAALKIQVQMVHERHPVISQPDEVMPGDYSDHRKVMIRLASRFPRTIIWGTDSPAYSYICRRRQSESVMSEFRLKARYEDECAALDALSEEQRMQVCNRNTREFLFGMS
ncbi:amidohydrolase family protein [Verrucomicrobiota bacterium]